MFLEIDMKCRENQMMGLEAIKEIDRIFLDNDIWYCLSYGSALGAYREHGFIEWDRDIDILVKRPDQKKITQLLKTNLPHPYKLISHLEDNVSGFDGVDIAGISSRDMHIDIYPLIGGPDDLEKNYHYMKYCRRVHRIFGCKYLEFKMLLKKWKIPFVILIRLFETLIPDVVMRRYIDKLEDKYCFENSNYFFPFANDGKRGEIMEAELLFKTKRIRFEDTMLPVPENTEEYLRRIYGDNYMTPLQY